MSVPRPPARRAAVALITVLVLLPACSGRQTVPRSYGDTTRRNFQKGCLASGREQKVDGIEDICKCAYAKITAAPPAGIAFDDFKKDYSDLQDKPGRLPARYLAIVQACVRDSSPPG